MQYLLLSGPLPDASEVIDLVAAHLRASTPVTDYMGPGGEGRVFAHDLPALQGLVPRGSSWAAVLVRQPVNPFGSRSSVLGRVPVFARVHVYAAADVKAAGYDPRRYIARLHERIDAHLRGLRFTLGAGGGRTPAQQAYPLFRFEDPGVPEYTDDHRAFWAASTYRTDLFPAA